MEVEMRIRQIPKLREYICINALACFVSLFSLDIPT